jgi:pimeloyl-ACP methyl ester carboxylesterase
LSLNVLAYFQARAFTHFVVASGSRTPKPEQLKGWDKLRTILTGPRVPRPANAGTPADVGLPFEVRQIPSGTAALEAWLVRNPGARAWVFLFHGYSQSKEQLLTVARRFHELGYQLLMVDFRGSGGSTGGNSTSIGYFEAEDVNAVVTWARYSLGAEDPILYGFSMGGAAVLRAAAQLGTPAKALVIESVFDRMFSTVENRFRILGLPTFPLARLLVFWGGVQHGFSAMGHNPVDYAAKVTCPTLLIHGEQDRRVTVDQITSVYRRLAGRKQLRIVLGAGHEVSEHLSAEAWNTLIQGFLHE